MYALKVITRKQDIRLSKPKEYVRQRIAESAEGWNRAGTALARVELVNETLCHLAELLYLPDSDGVLANVDSRSYRLLIPAPWGVKGWQVWGLRRWEGRTLRAILWQRQTGWKPGQRPPLFSYDDTGNYWHLNLPDYGSLEAAGWYLKRSAITLAEWRRVSATTPAGEPGRVSGGMTNGAP